MNPITAPQGDNGHPFVVVTGASEGIGRAIAERFARHGRDVILVARGEAALRAAADEIATAHRVRAIPFPLDVTADDAPDRLTSAADDAGGHVDILVNNAGAGLSGHFADADVAHIERVLDLNIRASTRLMRHVLPGMRRRGRGGVINIASAGGYTPGPWQAVYYASKAYLISLSEAVAAEVAAEGVHVMVVAPGPVNTRFHGKMDAEASYYRRFLPAPAPASVAAATVAGWRLGLRLVLSDFSSVATFPFLRFVPHRLLIPIVGWLLKPR